MYKAGYPDHSIIPCFNFSNGSNGQHVVYVSGAANELQQTEVSSIWTRITIRLFVIKLALKWSTSDGNGVVGPRRHTMNSTVAATGIEKILSAFK